MGESLSKIGAEPPGAVRNEFGCITNIVLYTNAPASHLEDLSLYGVRLATACRLRVKDFHHQAAPQAQVSIRRRIRDRVREYFGIAIMHLRRRPGYWRRRVRAESQARR